MPGIERLCWDTCIFYAVLKGEEHRAGELDVLREKARQFNEGALEIVASTLVIAEVLEGKLSESEAEEFERIMQRSNMLLVDVNPFVARGAAHLRRLQTAEGHTLSAADAIHVASAVEFGVEMWTLDENNKPNEGAGILKLASQIKANHGIDVRRPHGQAGING